MRALLILVLVGSSTLSVCTQDYVCTSPSNWTAQISVTDFKRNLWGIGNFSYDYAGQRQSIVQHLLPIPATSKDMVTTCEIVKLYKEKTQYMLMSTPDGNITCTKTPLMDTFVPFGIHKEFTPVLTICEGDLTDSGQCSGTVMETWTGKVHLNTTTESVFVASFLRQKNEKCLLMQEEMITDGIDSQLSFFNFTVGIVDPVAFKPPAECV